MTVERMFFSGGDDHRENVLFSGGDDCRENVFQEVMTVERRKKNLQEKVMIIERMRFFRRK